MKPILKMISGIWPGVIVQTNENGFYLAGSGVAATIKNLNDSSLSVGILKDDKGRSENKDRKVIRHLNGDQTRQGKHVCILLHDNFILRFELYNYE